MIDLKQILEDIKILIEQVGEFQIQEQNNSVKYKKGEDDIVTNVDLESEKKIISHLLKYNFNILSEEIGFINNNSKYTFVIDPLDGTKNYATSKNEFSISIALMKQNNIILGVIYIPLKNKLFTAIKNKGAYLNNQKIEVSKIKDINFATIPTSYNSNSFTNSSSYNEVPLGSLSYRICSIAEGMTDFSVIHKTNLWDIAAATIILKEAGGEVIDFKGKEYNFNTKEYELTNILFSNNLLKNEVLKLI